MRGTVVHVIGAVATFVVSVLFLLLLKGMLSFKPPFVVDRSAAARADSALVRGAPGTATPRAPAADSTSAEREAPPGAARHGVLSPLDSLTLSLAAYGPGEFGREPGDSEPASEDIEGANTPAEDPAPTAPFQTEKLARLVRVYEKMRPKQVALLFDSLPEGQTVAVLAQMNERAAAKVIAAMDPTNAARMSQLLLREDVR